MSAVTAEWPEQRLGDIVNLTNGFAFKKSQWSSEGLPIIRIQNLNNPAKPFNYYAENSVRDQHRVKSGDLLFAWSGTPGTSFGTHEWKGGDAWLNQHIYKVDFDSDRVEKRYLVLAINRNLDDYIRQAHGGAGLAHITKGKFESSTIPLPPLPEQRRIVAKIEELFSHLDVGVAALHHAKAQLQLYRQSVLAAAVTGELTKAWREQHPVTEPADKLLQRILKQRREQWNGRRKYKEPPIPVTDGLPEFPPSWTWATVAQQADPHERSITDGPFGSKLKSSHYTESGPRVLRLQNIGDGVFKDEYAHISDEHFETLANHQIFPGDLLIRALGIPPHQTCMVPEGISPAIVKADCIRFKVFDPHIDPKFTLFALNSHPVRVRTEKHIHGVGRPRLNGTEIKSIALPLPPIAEQHQIVAEVESRTTAIDHLEAELDRQITRSNKLRQATLALAFSGKLGCEQHSQS